MNGMDNSKVRRIMTLTADERKVHSAIQDPGWFLREVLGADPYGKQVEIAQAVKSAPRVSVVGCNGSGKDWQAARAILWWMMSQYPAKAIVTGPTARQVDDIVWNELRFAYNNSRAKLGGRLFDSPRWAMDEQHFAVGFSTDNPYSLQGYHSPNLLVVITEAHAMKLDDVTALRRLNPKCLLMTGNPLVNTGPFYDSHHAERHLYATVEISAFDTPNLDQDAPPGGLWQYPGMVTKNDVAARAEEWSEESPLYIGGVLGQFPHHLDDTMVPLSAIRAATQRETERPQGPVILGVDVARFGSNKSVVVRRQGGKARIVMRVQGRDTMQIAGWIANYLRRQNDVAAIVIDDDGLGGGVTDRLREIKTGKARIIDFHFGRPAHDERQFANRASEVWWQARLWLMGESEADLEPDPALMGQLASRGYSFMSDGRIKVDPKEKGPGSPDEADALVMTFEHRAVRGPVTILL